VVLLLAIRTRKAAVSRSRRRSACLGFLARARGCLRADVLGPRGAGPDPGARRTRPHAPGSAHHRPSLQSRLYAAHA
jgi:hypothetical protein